MNTLEETIEELASPKGAPPADTLREAARNIQIETGWRMDIVAAALRQVCTRFTFAAIDGKPMSMARAAYETIPQLLQLERRAGRDWKERG